VILARAVGLGLASRGDVREAVEYVERARAAGLTSVWFHESYFERDAVTYAAAAAAGVADIGIGLGALSTYARPTALTAMTVSALDDLAPERISVALGSALPLRLAQMGIDYKPDEAIASAEKMMADLRRLWRGERLPSGTAGFPELEPMFAPLHRVPLWVAGYRRAFHELAGRAADGYLARPAESLPAIELAVRRIADAAIAAGRSPSDIAIGGYLLALVDDSRRAALDRARREPFVIYMLSVQSDTAMVRAGLDPQLRHDVAAAWRREDYHAAAGLIPDEFVDVFLLCGTASQIAEPNRSVCRRRDDAAYLATGTADLGPGPRRTRGRGPLRPEPFKRGPRRTGRVHRTPRRPGRSNGDRRERARAAPAGRVGRDHSSVQLHRLDRARRSGRCPRTR
jgi:alkanesulfonate monooxygenase SsuD/methylene tetrahydromethanopterin reductase-like flavin-dependent oxidoreductase (luciferase family)